MLLASNTQLCGSRNLCGLARFQSVIWTFETDVHHVAVALGDVSLCLGGPLFGG